MLSQMSTIDKNGRVVLPKSMLDALGIASDSQVVIELTDAGIAPLIFLDVNVFMYAAGAPHPYKVPCVKILSDAEQWHHAIDQRRCGF